MKIIDIIIGLFHLFILNLNFKKTSSNQLNLVDSLIFEFLIRFITWKFLLGLIEENQKNFKSLLK